MVRRSRKNWLPEEGKTEGGTQDDASESERSLRAWHSVWPSGIHKTRVKTMQMLSDLSL